MGGQGAEASGIVEVAGALAREHRHHAIEPEHLLVALLRHDRIEIVLAQRALERELLEQAVLLHIAKWPAAGLYRDAPVEPVPSAHLEALLVRAGARRLMAFFRPVSFDDLANAACTEPRLAPLLDESRAASRSGNAILMQAETFSLSRGEQTLTFLHVLHVLVTQPAMGEALHELGVDSASLLVRLGEHLDEGPDPAHRLRRNDRSSKSYELVNAMLGIRAVQELLADAGGSALALKRALVRSTGEIVDESSLPDEGEAKIDIVFHDDDFTTMEFVVQALDQAMAVPADEATALMLSVHAGGAKIVKTCPAREARSRIAKARALAREAGMPLRISRRHQQTAE